MIMIPNAVTVMGCELNANAHDQVQVKSSITLRQGCMARASVG